MTRPHLKPAVLLTLLPDGGVAYDVERDVLHRLNPSATLVADLCDGERTLADLERIVGPLVGADGWQACRRWLDEGLEAGLLAGAPSSSASRAALTPRALADRADVLRERGQIEAAFACQQRAADVAPDEAEHWYRLGELAHILGHREAARHAYERYASQHPDDAEVAHLLTALRDEPVPMRASDQYVEALYARFASFYDDSMCDDLDYRAPALLAEAIWTVLGDRHHPQVLDLGCGTGLSGAFLRGRAQTLTGVDLSTAMLDLARGRGVYDALHHAEITAWLERGSDPFEVVVSCDALIYFGDLQQVIAPAARRLAPGGVLAFTVERDDRYPYRLTDSGRFSHHPDHVRDVARDAGLTVLHAAEAVLRREYGEDVWGLVAVLGRPERVMHSG